MVLRLRPPFKLHPILAPRRISVRTARLMSALALFFLLLSSCATAAQKPARTIADLPPEAQSGILAAIARSGSRFPASLQRRPANPPPTDGPWVQLAQPVGSADQLGYLYGTSVAVSGNIVVVGQVASALVFVKPTSGAWNNLTQSAVLLPSDSGTTDSFAASVAISGNTIVVGSPPYLFCGTCDAGKAYVYVEPTGGWSGTLTETAQLTASDGINDAGLGSSVGIAGNTVVVGAPGETPAGAAYVFVEPASGWISATQTAKLTSSDGATGDAFGTSVSVSGNTIVAGAPTATVNGSHTGAAYVFVEPVSGWANATQTAKLTASDGASNDYLGFSVAISGSTVVAGAPYATGTSAGTGSSYLFVKPAGNWVNSNQTAKLTAPDGQSGDAFGSAVAIWNNTAVVGAPERSPGPLNFRGYPPWWREGGAYVFARSGSGWTHPSVQVVNGADARNDDLLGASVGISGDLIVAGAPYLGKYLGGAFVFTKP